MYLVSGFIFGAAKPTPVDLRNTRNPRLANLIVSGAGPVSNFLLCGVAILLLRVIGALVPGSLQDLAVALTQQVFASGALAPITYLLFIFAMVNAMLGGLQPDPHSASRRQRRARGPRRASGPALLRRRSGPSVF